MSAVEAPALWSTAAAAQAAGLSYRQLDHWCRAGVMVPVAVTDWWDNPSDGATLEAPGTGRARRFSDRQVTVLRACGELARLCAGTEVLAALVAACADVSLPVVVAIDGDGRAHVGGADVATAGACWVVAVGR